MAINYIKETLTYDKMASWVAQKPPHYKSLEMLYELQYSINA